MTTECSDIDRMYEYKFQVCSFDCVTPPNMTRKITINMAVWKYVSSENRALYDIQKLGEALIYYLSGSIYLYYISLCPIWLRDTSNSQPTNAYHHHLQLWPWPHWDHPVHSDLEGSSVLNRNQHQLHTGCHSLLG